jgi:hypothetical protein
MRAKSALVARPKGAYQFFMDKGLAWRTGPEEAVTSPEPRRQLANLDKIPQPFRDKWQGAIDRGFALSPRHLCDIFDVSRGAVHNALTTGELPGFRLGTNWRIRPEYIPERLVQYWLAVKKNPYVPPPKTKDDLPKGELVYFITGAPRFVKIGYTTDLAKRIQALQIGCPLEIELLGFARGDRGLEYDYHHKFRAWRCSGEWFKLCVEIQSEIDRLNSEAA